MLKVKLHKKFNRADYITDRVYTVIEGEQLHRLSDVVFFTKGAILKEVEEKLSTEQLYDLHYVKEPTHIVLVYDDMFLEFLFLEDDIIDFVGQY